MLTPFGRRPLGPSDSPRTISGALRRHRLRSVSVLVMYLAGSLPALGQSNADEAAPVTDNAAVAPAAATRPPAVRRTKAASSKSHGREAELARVGSAASAASASAAPVGSAATQEASAPAAAMPEMGPPAPMDAGLPSAGIAGAPNAEGKTVAAATEPAASAAPSASAAAAIPSARASSAPGQYELAEVKIRDSVILRLKLADGGLLPKVRTQRAQRAIEAALADSSPGQVRTELRQDRAILFVGQRPIVELTRADAEAIGEGSLELFAASAAAKVTDVLESERQRSAVTHSVFNVTIVIALAVLVLYALRILGILARKTREFVHRNPEHIPAIRLRSIEVVGPHVLRSGIVVGLGVVKLLLQVGLVFAWLLFSSSLFDATRGMTDRLTSLVLTPLSGLATRFAALLPLLLLTTIGAVVLVVLVRFVGLFFAGVERHETELSWLRPELAAPTSLLIRVALVVLSLLVAAPLVTGNVEGSLARVGMLSVVAVGLATTPLVANVVVGLVTLYGGRLKLGDAIAFGIHRGILDAVDLIELHLKTDDGKDLRIPHLVTLVQPMTTFAAGRTTTRRLVVTAEVAPERLLETLEKNSSLSEVASVLLTRLEGPISTVELIAKRTDDAIERQLLIAVARQLQQKQIRLILAEWRSVA